VAVTAPSAACTRQRAFVLATPAATYAAIWKADLVSTPLARALSELAVAPVRLGAAIRGEPAPPPPQRSAHLADMLGPDSPWLLLADEPGHEVVLGLLWTPPAGAASCTPEEFSAFAIPGVAKVTWSLSVAPFGAGHTLLTSATRTTFTDAAAERRFRLLWPLMAPFAALLRNQVLRAVTREAESD
jgi:hypothetical protein